MNACARTAMRGVRSGSMQKHNIHKITKPAQSVARIFCELLLQEISMPSKKLSYEKFREILCAALASAAIFLLPLHCAQASQGPGGGPGTASSFTQLAMAILVYGTSALVVGSGLIGALRKH
jgi:hypothetical protein